MKILENISENNVKEEETGDLLDKSFCSASEVGDNIGCFGLVRRESNPFELKMKLTQDQEGLTVVGIRGKLLGLGQVLEV